MTSLLYILTHVIQLHYLLLVPHYCQEQVGEILRYNSLTDDSLYCSTPITRDIETETDTNNAIDAYLY